MYFFFDQIEAEWNESLDWAIVGLFHGEQVSSIVTTEYSFSSDKITQSLDGYKILQLSDLHSKSFGDEQGVLVEKVINVNPNLILFTGDLVDSERYNEKTSLYLMRKLVQIAPVYYVTGNHEWWSGKFSSLESKMKDIGVQVMRNSTVALGVGQDKIQLLGIDDPAKLNESYAEKAITEEAIKNSLKGLKKRGNIRILLAHRPELLPLYSKFEIDLVFSGHAHGGQFRIPFVGGLVAPNQGILPEYTSGKHRMENTTMIVNRGLGNSIIPLRVFNRPEIVVVIFRSVK